MAGRWWRQAGRAVPAGQHLTHGNVCRMDLSPRVRAVCDLDVSEVREYAGRHEYDGKPQDLSPAGVRAGLARLAAARASGERLADAHDEAHLSAAEEHKRVAYAELELHRRNPILHLGELDLACYDRDYAAPGGTGRRAGRAPRRLAAGRRRGHRITRPGERAGRRGTARRHTRTGGRAQRGAGGPGVPAGARPPWRPRGPRTRDWSRTPNARRRTATPIRRSAVPGSPP